LYWVRATELVCHNPTTEEKISHTDFFSHISLFISHGRLTECFESAGGNAAAATFIVIDPPHRGCGMGSQLMLLLEKEAQRLGYHYVYLWTKTAIDFYKKIGYQESQRVSLKRSCLKILEANQVQTLEALLLKKSKKACTTNKKQPSKPKETILLPPGDDDDTDLEDVWLRKRLVEHVGSIHVPLEERLEELKEAISSHPSRRDWYYRLLSLPWQAQIGPSCGLAALRMVREYFWTDSNSPEQQLPSLLGEAQERGYTNDGEIFNANHLQDLADTICGIECDMLTTLELTPKAMDKILSTGGVLILPYDSNARTRLPTQLLGQSAHYGVIVGLLIGLDSSGGKGLELNILEDSAIVGNATTIYLLVQHSLSSKLSIASWSDFMESNQQLVSVDEGKFGQKNLDLRDRIIVCRTLRPNTTTSD
jgi:hypothetical protein